MLIVPYKSEVTSCENVQKNRLSLLFCFDCLLLSFTLNYQGPDSFHPAVVAIPLLQL